ncbi:MAG: conserved membrane protein of unknown function [Promethearchaeota archaeon]|nr:MAG: conserved membrane protein of unknown function [Candidatus Lokiarchaeota archaeon]
MLKKNTWNRIIIILAFSLIFGLSTIMMFTTPPNVKSQYGLTAKTEDGVNIAFNVFEPTNEPTELKKAVIIGHGYMANKEFMKGYALELASAGFVAITLDFRGHGQSTGSLERGSLIDDVRAIKEYLASREDIDINNLGYIGYSMGGGPGNQIIKDDKDFKCFIGVGTGLPTEGSQIRLGNETNPLNVLMIYARYDEAFSLDRLKEGLSVRVGEPAENIDSNQLYGSFENGNASKIYLDDNSNHLLVAWDQDFIRQARDWVINTFPEVDQLNENFYVNTRGLILFFQILGGLGLFFMIIEPLSKQIIPKNDEKGSIELGEEEDLRGSSEILKMVLFSLGLGIPGLILMMLPLSFLPMAIASFVISLLFGSVFGLLIFLYLQGKKRNSSLREMLKEPLTISRRELLRQILLGIGLTCLLYLILYLSLGNNYIGIIPSISKIIWIPLYFIPMFITYYIYSYTYTIIAQKNFKGNLSGMFKSGLLTFGIQYLYIITYILLISFLSGSLFYFGTMIPVATPILVLASFIYAVTYQKTKNILLAVIINSTFFLLIICTISPIQSPLEFLLRFI